MPCMCPDQNMLESTTDDSAGITVLILTAVIGDVSFYQVQLFRMLVCHCVFQWTMKADSAELPHRWVQHMHQ